MGYLMFFGNLNTNTRISWVIRKVDVKNKFNENRYLLLKSRLWGNFGKTREI